MMYGVTENKPCVDTEATCVSGRGANLTTVLEEILSIQCGTMDTLYRIFTTLFGEDNPPPTGCTSTCFADALTSARAKAAAIENATAELQRRFFSE